jgi:hypothetical protein
VRKSSHGEFQSVAELVEHQKLVSKPAKPARVEHFTVQSNWLSHD